MQKLFFASAMLLASTLQAETFSVNVPELQQEGKQVIKQLVSTLGGELKKAKQQGGPAAAVALCNKQASPLTAEVNTQTSWQISRTSLKLRNPDNAPDEWETQVLQHFANKARQGANLKTLAFSQVVVDEKGQRVFRMMKAIPVSQQCLGCHGSKIKPELQQQLEGLYPQDKAIGFSEGDLRGAFSLKKIL